MKTSRHSMMAKGIMVLLSLMILVFIFTYSWYIPPDFPASTNGLSFSTDCAVDFDMAIGFVTQDTGHYVATDFTGSDNKAIDFANLNVHNNLSLSNSSTVVQNQIGRTSASFDLFSSYNPVDLTGNGATLVRPYMKRRNTAIETSQYRVMYDYDQLKEDYQNVYYISFDLYVRAPVSDYRISIVDGSYVISAAETYYRGSKTYRTILEDEDLDNAIAAKTYHSRLSADNIDATMLNSGKIARRSSYGDFSEDSVVGAIRIGVMKYDTVGEEDIDDITSSVFFSGNDTAHLASTPSLLWIPRSDIYLQNEYEYSDVSGKYVESPYGWTLYDESDTTHWDDAVNYPAIVSDETLGKVSSGKSYKEMASTHTYYDWAKMLSHQSDNGGAGLAVADRYTTDTSSYVVTSLAQNKKIIIEPMYEDGGYYYGKCHVNLWIEGCDAEARKAIDGGKFFFGFQLESLT